MAETVELVGLAELSELLTQESSRAAKRYLRKCADAAARVVLDEMRQTVPVGIGILEESLIYKARYSGADETILTIEIGPTRKAFWGSLQEFGTKFQPAQHWMGRAWEACKNRCLAVFVEKAREITEDLAAKAKK